MMNKWIKSGGACLLMAALALTIGCGKSGPPRPKTYPVSGTVTYKGEPVGDANLNFQLADGSAFSMAKTDAAGKYALMTYEPGDGALPGEYKVGITKYEMSTVTGSGPEAPDYEPPEGDVAAPAKNLLPTKYSNPQTSGLTATITEGTNTFHFDLID